VVSAKNGPCWSNIIKPFLFDALALHQRLHLPGVGKIYRQSEATFINILNNIRNNRATSADLGRLHDHYRPISILRAGKLYHPDLSQCKATASTSRSCQASRQGPFLRGCSHGESRSGPSRPKEIAAERGAQIMLIKNDKGEARRFFNGKIGAIKKNLGR